MTEVLSTIENISKRVPWNKGKVVGAKPPLRPKHVWSIRTKLQVDGASRAAVVGPIRTKLQLEGRTRDLALFNIAIDSKLRGCDVVAVRVDDVTPGGCSLDRATVRQKRPCRPALVG